MVLWAGEGETVGKVSCTATRKHTGPRKISSLIHDSSQSPAVWRGGQRGLFLYGKGDK